MKWKTLQHNGILFPPDFESKGIKIKIKGENITPDLTQEEMIYQWAKKKDAPKPGMTEKYVEDPIFQKNFVSDLTKTLDKKFNGLQYNDIDFSEEIIFCTFLMNFSFNSGMASSLLDGCPIGFSMVIFSEVELSS